MSGQAPWAVWPGATGTRAERGGRPAAPSVPIQTSMEIVHDDSPLQTDARRLARRLRMRGASVGRAQVG